MFLDKKVPLRFIDKAVASLRGKKMADDGESLTPAPSTGSSARFGLHHVQLAIPVGSEDEARAFYVKVLGLKEMPKPPALAARGGFWVQGENLELHLGVDHDFRPAAKAHPGILVSQIDTFAERLTVAGLEPRWDDDFPGMRRFYLTDPFGNRLEFLSPLPDVGTNDR